MEFVERQIESVRNFSDALFGPFDFIKRTPYGDRYDLSFRYCGKQMLCKYSLATKFQYLLNILIELNILSPILSIILTLHHSIT
jgi:hypothetical protein